MQSRDCTDEFSAYSTTRFFLRTSFAKYKKHDRREPGLFKAEFRCTEMICFCSKTFCVCDSQSKKLRINSIGLNKRMLEDNGDGPMF